MPFSGKLPGGWAARKRRTSSAKACSSAEKPKSMRLLRFVGSPDPDRAASPLSLLGVPAHERDAEGEGSRHIDGVGASQGELRGQARRFQGQATVHGDEAQARQGQE